jgi:3-dehydroquinate synthetase
LDHGIGVAIGLFVESMVGFQKGYVSRKVVLAAERLLDMVDPYVSLKGRWGMAEFAAALGKDKKNRQGNVHMVFLEEVGRVYEGNVGVRVDIDTANVAFAFGLLNRFRRS